MKYHFPKKLLLLHVIFGLSDFLTGVLLIVMPSFIFSLLTLFPYPDEFSYVSYVGVFVMLTGIYYALPFIPLLQDTAKFSFQHVWVLTSITRSFVATFVILSVCFGSLSLSWLIVAFSDALIAAIQVYLVKKHSYV